MYFCVSCVTMFIQSFHAFPTKVQNRLWYPTGLPRLNWIPNWIETLVEIAKQTNRPSIELGPNDAEGVVNTTIVRRKNFPRGCWTSRCNGTHNGSMQRGPRRCSGQVYRTGPDQSQLDYYSNGRRTDDRGRYTDPVFRATPMGRPVLARKHQARLFIHLTSIGFKPSFTHETTIWIISTIVI